MPRRIWRFLLKFYFMIFGNKEVVELDKFKWDICYKTELARYLNDFQKPGTRHDFNLKNFSILYSHGHGYCGFESVYQDATYTLVLTYDNEAIACIGFEVVDGSAILIKQIQGVKGRLTILKYFRWEKMLLNIAMDWAKNAGFKAVKIIRGESSGWYSPYLAQSLFMKYDVTARRSGFKFDEENKTYFRNLA